MFDFERKEERFSELTPSGKKTERVVRHTKAHLGNISESIGGIVIYGVGGLLAYGIDPSFLSLSMIYGVV